MQRAKTVFVVLLALVLVVPVEGSVSDRSAAAQQGEGTWTATSPYAVKDNEPAQWDGVVTDDYVAWTQYNPRDPDVINAWIQPHGGKWVKANWGPAMGFVGDVDRHRIIYTQIHRAKPTIKIFNVRRKRRFDPKKVNTRHREDRPSIWKNRVFYRSTRILGPGRDVDRVFWVNIKNGRKVRLARQGSPGRLLPGQINGNWAVWTRCDGDDNCFIVRHNVVSRKRIRINPQGLQVGHPSVLGDGTVFYAAATEQCENEEYRRFVPEADDEVVLALSDGEYISSARAKQRSDGRVTIAFGRTSCSDARADIYAVDLTRPSD